ncbi:acyltransferase family protein [Aneurinibacillus migulanus]|uniref:acyltransferase family protein n=1 Tax=Aneurinibacillus migulanus TaxID=47500 RepID=UPI000696E50B|nr:acyltransferase [Aneurinibacillus migulanus]CEH29438.1 Acyltransferase 3 [Aneurinibacillus migulanus]
MEIGRESRISFLDNLKLFLSITVIAHHAGQPYGGSEGWWYVKDSVQPVDLGPFFGVNAAFNMSLYFLISAFFIPLSFDKKGASGFLKERLKRLGIPLLFGFFVLIPVMMYTYYLNYRNYAPISFGNYYLNVYFGFGEKPESWTGPSWPDLNFGHLWFIQHLLIYSLLYILWKVTFKTEKTKKKTFNITVTYSKIVLFTSIIATLTFVTRIWYPIDHWIGFLGFIQMEVAHFPQYLSFFFLGIIASQTGLIQSIPSYLGRTSLGIGIGLVLLIYLGIIPSSKGGFTGVALFYAFYETTLCLSLVVGLISLFMRTLNVSTAFSRKLAANTYAVYIIHVPVLVALQYAFLKINIPGYVKFPLITLLGIFLCNVLSHFVVRKFSYLSIVVSGSSNKTVSRNEQLSQVDDL